MDEIVAETPLEIIPRVCGVSHESACCWLPVHKGVLKVFADRMEFHGRAGVLEINAIREISYGKRPGDFVEINPWVKVLHGEGQAIYLLDAGWLGWRGICGGTRRLLLRLKEKFPEANDCLNDPN